ncbi:MAG: hypothetical protein RXP77_03750 [Nitrososphaeria archaeon]
MIRAVKVDSDVGSLLQELSRDLRSSGLSRVARIPAPRVGERYSDVLASLYRTSGNALATIWLEMDDGTRKVYSFYMRVDLEAGSGVGNLLDAPASVSGHLIEIRGGDAVLREYSPLEFRSASEMFPRIEEMAELYRLSEDRILSERALEDYYGWLRAEDAR